LTRGAVSAQTRHCAPSRPRTLWRRTRPWLQLRPPARSASGSEFPHLRTAALLGVALSLVLVHRCSESVWRAGVPPDSTLPSLTPPATRGSPAVLPVCSMRMTWETTRAELHASSPEVRCTTTPSIRPVSPARLEKSGPLPVRPVPRPRSRHTELKSVRNVRSLASSLEI
jgi:hypothetical protein